jgi:hypothetical protein
MHGVLSKSISFLNKKNHWSYENFGCLTFTDLMVTKVIKYALKKY